MNQAELRAPAVAPLESAWPAGHRIGSFELQAVASCGANGIVYRAWDFALARAVAVKEYMPAAITQRDRHGQVRPLAPQDTEAFSRGRRAFVANCQTLGRCDHPSLARVLHLIEAHGTVYCVMPWYTGRALLEVLPKIGHPVEEPLLRSLLDDFLGALDTYHRVGGMHGGISPSKVLLLDDDRGLLLGPSTAGYTARPGWPDAVRRPADRAFAAAEQQVAATSAQPQGPWTDFYTLASIMRFWMSGVLPQGPGLDPLDPLLTTLGRQPVHQPEVPYSGSLLRALDAAMSADIGKRPQTAAQFRQWLGQAPNQPATAHDRASTPAFLPPQPSAPPTSPTPPKTHRLAPAADTRKDPTDIAGAADPGEEVDAATVDTIRRVIASIPDATGHAPRPPGLDRKEPIGLERSRMAASGAAAPAAPSPQRRQTWPRIWTGLGVLAAASAALAIAAWQVLPSLDRDAEQERALTQAPPAAQPAVSDELPTSPATPADSTTAVATMDAQPSVLPPRVIEPVVLEPPQQNSTPASPAAATPQPSMPQRSAMPNERGAGSPRALCGARTEFALYRCMQQQCSLDTWKLHPQCLQLKATDKVE